MKPKKLMFFLTAAAVIMAVLLIILTRTGMYRHDSAILLLVFPFVPVYRLAAKLSEGGGIRSGLAAAVWVLISLLPLIPAVKIRGKKEVLAERLVWCALSVFLFIIPFNGFRLSGSPGLSFGGMEQLTYCLLLWSLAVTAVILYLVRLFKRGDTSKLYSYLRMILMILAFFVTIKIVLALMTSGLLDLFFSGAGMNGYSIAYRGLMFLLIAVPAILEIWVIFAALDFIDCVLSEEQEGIVQFSKQLSAVCCRALSITVIFCTVIELALFFFIGKTENVDFSLNLPFTQILFVLMTLLFSRLITENRELRDDNSLFI